MPFQNCRFGAGLLEDHDFREGRYEQVSGNVLPPTDTPIEK